MYNNINLLLDVAHEEKSNQLNTFIEHRHDQAILSLLLMQSTYIKIKQKWENFEARAIGGQAIYAARSKAKFQRKDNPHILKYLFRHYFMYPYKSCLLNLRKIF